MMDPLAEAVADLRHSQHALAMIVARDPRAWQIAEALASYDLDRRIAALAQAKAAAETPDASVPDDVAALLESEDGLEEIFGPPWSKIIGRPLRLSEHDTPRQSPKAPTFRRPQVFRPVFGR